MISDLKIRIKNFIWRSLKNDGYHTAGQAPHLCAKAHSRRKRRGIYPARLNKNNKIKYF